MIVAQFVEERQSRVPLVKSDRAYETDPIGKFCIISPVGFELEALLPYLQDSAILCSLNRMVDNINITNQMDFFIDILHFIIQHLFTVHKGEKLRDNLALRSAPVNL